MKQMTNKFTVAILLFWLSMCIWKICSLAGQANVYCMVAVSLLDMIGLIIIIGNIYQLEEWSYGEWWLYHCSRWIVIGLIMWIVVLCWQIGSATSLSLSDLSFDNVSMVSYVTLQACYLLNGILTMAISIFYTVALIKTSEKPGDIQISRYIQQQKRFCSSYAAGVILCRLISAIFLNTGEHKSTPASNMILNLLYFCMLIYLIISLHIYWKKAQILLSAADSVTDISEGIGWKPHYLKRIWIIVLMCTVISGYGAIANYSVEMDFEYQESNMEDGIVLKEYTGKRAYVKIPKQINGQQVIGLAASFRRCDFIKDVSIPQGVKSVGYETFYECRRMSAISLPDSVEEIGDYAFASCESLEKVKLSSNLKVIKLGAFAGCNSLKQIMIPGSVTEIRRYAFGYCKNLTELTIPDGVSIIEEKTFTGCSGLKQIVLPESIRKIDKEAFNGCSVLEEIELPEGLTAIQEKAFYDCSGLIHVTLPQSLKWIEADAFAKCINLKTIQMPQGIDYIASDAFRDCENLESTIPKTSFMDRKEVIVP